MTKTALSVNKVTNFEYIYIYLMSVHQIGVHCLTKVDEVIYFDAALLLYE